ncbi:MAG: hypothetical protein KKB39_03940 [Nanoarchaeota archaeon]|nr:hypothetical protein [Nanoarchaeota archaeon]
MAFEITVGRDEKAQKELGEKGRVLIGKAYVKMGRTTSLSNPIYMDVARAHVVYIVGKRGSGKCMVPETKIKLLDNSWLTIEEIYKRYSNNSKITLQNEKEQLLEIDKSLIIKSMAPNLTLINMPVSHIYRKKVKEDLYILKVEDREITVTAEHPLFVLKNNAFSWIPASELEENDKIAIPLKNQNLISIQNSGKELIKQEQIIFNLITKIEKISYEGYVYDLTVPFTHNFVAGENEGIICHNSYSMGAIAEGIMDLDDEVRNNLSMIMFDTMGVYWTMKYPNEKDADLLDAWGLEGKGMPVKIYTPYGFFDKYKEDGVPTDSPFSIKASDLGSQDWILSFQLAQDHPTTIIIEKVLGDMIDEGINDYNISDIIKLIEKDKDFEKHDKNDAINRFRNAERWGLFSETGTNMMDLVQPGQVTVLDLSPYVATPGGWGVKSLVIGLIGMRVFSQRMLARKSEEIDAINVGYSYFQTEQELGNKQALPIVWFVVDECLPKDTEVITSTNHTPIGDIYDRFNTGEKFQVLGYDSILGEYGYYDVTKVWKRPPKKLIKMTSETGRQLKCTPEHKVYSKEGFIEALSCDNLAVPLSQFYSVNPKLIKARLAGHILGDEWLSEKEKTIGFSGKGCSKDLHKIKEDLDKLGFKSSNIYSRKTKSKITTIKGKSVDVNGTSHSIHASHKAFDYFSKLNLPLGQKVLTKSKLPSWIKNGSDKEKAEFLAALIGADGTAPSPAKKTPSDFNPIRFSFNKIEELEDNALEFANELKVLFKDLGINISKISKREGNLRKDGKNTIKFVLTIAKNTDNMINFLEKVGYRYCSIKEMKANKWLSYLKARQFIINERENLRKEALKLKKQGLGKIKIARKLKAKEYDIRGWIYFNYKAGVPKDFPSFEQWIKERQQGNTLHEKIVLKKELEAEEVYDISVDKVHNFVAQGCVVHNCHEFLPKVGKTAATDALVTIMREGRQPGVCLMMATQQPGKIHSDVMSQSDIILSHRLTAKPDVEALASMSQSYLAKGLPLMLDNLPRAKGAGILLDDNSERFYPMRVRPRLTWHGGEAPSAVKYKRKLDLGLE